jgi:hypothetical protein
MTVLIIWAFRLLVLYAIIRLAVAFLSKKHSSPGGGGQKSAPRFNAKGKKVEDADFEEL